VKILKIDPVIFFRGFMTRQIFILIIIAVLIVRSIQASDPSKGWKPEKIVPLSEYGIDPSVRMMRLSPSGKQLMVFDESEHAFCIVSVVDGKKKNIHLPREFRGRPESVSWSLSDRFIVFTEDVFRYLNEPDIWVCDTESGMVKDLTPDGVTGSILPMKPGSSLDFYPIWRSNENRIIYIHAVNEGVNGAQRIELWSVSVPDGKPHRETVLSDDIPWSMVYPLPEISPDGKLMALFTCRNNDPVSNSVRIIDITTGKVTDLFSMKNMIDVLREKKMGSPDRLVVGNMLWTAGGKGLVIYFVSGSYSGPSNIYGYYDMTRSQLSPVFPGEKTALQQCIIMPDGKALVCLVRVASVDDSTAMRLLRIPLPQGEEKAEEIGTFRIDSSAIHPIPLAAASPDGMALLGSNLVHFVLSE
jgi:hypothetical protein